MTNVSLITSAKSHQGFTSIKRAMTHLQMIDTAMRRFARSQCVDIRRIHDIPGGRHYVMDDMIVAVLPGISIERARKTPQVLRSSNVFIVGMHKGKVARHHACYLSNINMLSLGRGVVQAQSLGYDVSSNVLQRVIDHSRKCPPGTASKAIMLTG